MSLCSVNLIPKPISAQSPFSLAHLLGPVSHGRNLENTALQPVEEPITTENREGPFGGSETHLWESSLYWTIHFAGTWAC